MTEHDEQNGQEPVPARYYLPRIPDCLLNARPEVREKILRMLAETYRDMEETDRFVWEVARRRGIFGISTST